MIKLSNRTFDFETVSKILKRMKKDTGMVLFVPSLKIHSLNFEEILKKDPYVVNRSINQSIWDEIYIKFPNIRDTYLIGGVFGGSPFTSNFEYIYKKLGIVMDPNFKTFLSRVQVEYWTWI
jgi:hypothetical protein